MCQDIITEYTCSHQDPSSSWHVQCNAAYEDSQSCGRPDTEIWRSGFQCPTCARAQRESWGCDTPKPQYEPDPDQEKHDSVMDGGSETSSAASPASSLKRKRRSSAQETLTDIPTSPRARIESRAEKIMIRFRFKKARVEPQHQAQGSRNEKCIIRDLGSRSMLGMTTRSMARRQKV